MRPSIYGVAPACRRRLHRRISRTRSGEWRTFPPSACAEDDRLIDRAFLTGNDNHMRRFRSRAPGVSSGLIRMLRSPTSQRAGSPVRSRRLARTSSLMSLLLLFSSYFFQLFRVHPHCFAVLPHRKGDARLLVSTYGLPTGRTHRLVDGGALAEDLLDILRFVSSHH